MFKIGLKNNGFQALSLEKKAITEKYKELLWCDFLSFPGLKFLSHSWFVRFHNF